MTAEDGKLMINEVPDTPTAETPDPDVGQVKFTKDSESIDVKAEQKLIGLTKEQLEHYRNDPFWKPVRYVVFGLFWLIWLAMFLGAVAIVVMSPKCAAKREQAWFQNTVAYQLFTPTFRDSDGDGVGDFKGVQEKLNDLRRIGVQTVWATPLLKTLKDEFNPAAVVDATVVDPRFGDADALKALIDEAHSLGLKFIADLPLTVHKDHAQAPKAGQGKVKLLDLTNREVRATLKRAATQLMDYGVDGLRLAQYGLTGASTDILERLAKEIRAEVAEHFHEDEPEDFVLVADTPIPLKSRSLDLYTRSLFRFPNATQSVCQSNDFLQCLTESASTGAQEIVRNASTVPLWQLGDVAHRRPDFQVDQKQAPLAAAAASALQLFLPGPVAVYYGEELGLPSVNSDQPQHGLMAWSAERNGGFSAVDGSTFFKQLPNEQIAQLNFAVYVLVVNWPHRGESLTRIFRVSQAVVPGRTATNAELVWDQPHNPENPAQMVLGSTKLTLKPYEYALLRITVSA